MESEKIDKDCDSCGEEATHRLKLEKRDFVFCDDCIKKIYWMLTHDIYLEE